jgi:anti-anti-sigma regulatory factor
MTSLRLGRLDVEIANTRVTLFGRIDDAAPLGELVNQIGRGEIVIDTDGVSFINSIGMREWIRLIRALRERGDTVVLERVSDVLMAQLNMISEARTAVRITSFHAQYVCPSCGAESAPVIEVAEHAASLAKLVAPKLPCPECSEPMELGDFPERYLLIFKTE